MTLQYLAVGTGRDGTVSLTQNLNDIFQLGGIKASAAHEYLARECYNGYCLFKETGDNGHLDHLRKLIRDCPYEAIVGNGYASVLPLFKEIFPDLALIHLKRRERGAVVLSHLKNSSLFPETYIYYGEEKGVMRRTAAFHEGEMSRKAWDSLSLEKKFGWFYDYTHRTIEAEQPKFRRHLTVHTESLSDQNTLNELARFVLKREGTSPRAVHLNRHAYLTIDDFSEGGRPYAQWLFGKLQAGDIEKDPVYLPDYTTNKFIALAGYQLSGFIREVAPAYAITLTQLSHSLDRFEALLLERLKEVRLLKADLKKKA